MPAQIELVSLSIHERFKLLILLHTASPRACLSLLVLLDRPGRSSDGMHETVYSPCAGSAQRSTGARSSALGNITNGIPLENLMTAAS